MIRSYKYLDTAVHLKLHEMIIAFFNRIEFERLPFQNIFFGYSLGYLAERHPQILKERCIKIYNELKGWNFIERAKFFSIIKESNEIENICLGKYEPIKIDRHAAGIYKTLRDLFIDLYNQVLDGDAFRELFSTNLREHFDEFCQLNSDITLCPVCGIGELKKQSDDIRDQYDHYFPKSIYPLSSVNFKNLVPICRECNSIDIKGDTDIVAVSTNKKLFFLFQDSYKELSLEFRIAKDDVNFENIVWEICVTNADGRTDEISSWMTIYKIESRYTGYIKARIEKWYRHYWSLTNDKDYENLTPSEVEKFYFKFLNVDESLGLSFIRRPAIVCLLKDSLLTQASIQAKHYSLPRAV